MCKFSWPGVALSVALTVAAVPAVGQTAPPSDDDALASQVQDTFRQIIQNMIAKGIDPRQFFTQMQSGTDPADIAKQMVDQGLIDPQSLTQLQTNTQKLSTGRIRARLEATDAEWAVLEPMIRKVMTAQAALQRAGGSMTGGGGGGGAMRSGLMSGFGAVQTPAGIDLSRAVRTLRTALQSKHASPDEITAALAALRDARDRAAAELAAAQKDLTSAVTTRQEGVLTSLGILE